MSLSSRSSPARGVLALADDLSGAAEVAVALRRPGRILLGPGAGAPSAPGEATVLDLDSRYLPADAAARAVRAAVAALDGMVSFKKVDSLLRGNLAAEAAAYAEGAEGVVIAPALPVAGRTVRDGVVRLRGVPLHATDAWRAESRAAPLSVAAALDGVPTAPVPLDAVRGPRGSLTGRLREVLAAGLHPVCDAETDADLDAIAVAALDLGPGVRLLGTGGLAGALGRVLGDGTGSGGPPRGAGAGHGRHSPSPNAGHGLRSPAPDAEHGLHGPSPDAGGRRGSDSRSPGAGTEHGSDSPSPGVAAARGSDSPSSDTGPGSGSEGPASYGARTEPRPLLVVVGTAEPGAVAQIAQLVAVGARHVPLPAGELVRQAPAPLPLPLSPDAVTVVSIAAGRGIGPGSARHLVAGLARTVAAAARDADLVLTGGETARRVLDALGVPWLTPVGQIHHGAVHSRTPDGRRVVTRPGSYGEADSLLRIARALRPEPAPPPLASTLGEAP